MANHWNSFYRNSPSLHFDVWLGYWILKTTLEDLKDRGRRRIQSSRGRSETQGCAENRCKIICECHDAINSSNQASSSRTFARKFNLNSISKGKHNKNT
jgi:hypothetical protein